MTSTNTRGVMALAQIADRQARQLRTLARMQFTQGVVLALFGLVLLAHTFILYGGLP